MGMMENSDKYKIKHKLREARAFEKEGKYLHAVQVYNSLMNEFPGSEEIAIRYAALLEKSGKYPAAKDMLGSFLEKNHDSPGVRLFLGQMMIRSEDFEPSIDVLSHLRISEEPVAAFLTGYAQYMLKEFKLADIAFRNFLEHAGKNELVPDAYFYLAKTHLNLDDITAATMYLDGCADYYDNHYEVHLLSAILHHRGGMYAHSLALIERAIKLKPSDEKVIEWAAEIYFVNENYVKARTYYKKFIETAPELTGDMYARLGYCGYMVKKYKEAAVNFEKALLLDPDNKLVSANVNFLNKYLRPVKK